MSATTLAKRLAKSVLPLPALTRLTFFRQYWLVGEWELRELSSLASQPGLAIDVGANIGLYSYALKRMGREVVSFEPDPTYQAKLKALLGDGASIENVALSDTQGIGLMRVPYVKDAYGGALASLSDHAIPNEAVLTSYEVNLRTLDSYDFEDVAFIKIDVEGHEESVLNGAHKTLQLSRPRLLIEIEERHNPGGIERIATRLSRLGYLGSFFYAGKQHHLSEFDPKVHQRQGMINSVGVDRRKIPYVNNFFFSVR